MGIPRPFSGFTASVHFNVFQIAAESVRKMACRHSTIGSMLVVKHGIGIFSFWKVLKHGFGRLQNNFLF